MGLIKINHKGSFNLTEQFFSRMLKKNYLNILSKYGEIGVNALKANTPSDSGKTAESWGFGIAEEEGQIRLYWTNSNENQGVNIAILIIYGHAAQNGSYVEGNDFVTPTMKPIFNQLSKEIWEEVTK